MNLETQVNMQINPIDQKNAADRISAALGSYIQALGKTDFTEWSEEEWNSFVAVAFDVAAVETFKLRMTVTGPTINNVPF